MIGQTIGPYTVLAKVGEGGMGEVYRARDSKLKRDVAIKVLAADVANDPERLARFQREAEVLASLNHPRIAHVYGIEDRALVMELVEGEDLAERLKRAPIPIDEALPIARQIAEALEAAHDAGVIHRDLKPANVKVRSDGTVKVLDFGLAKALGQDLKTSGPQDLANSPTITSPAMTAHGMILGTAAYMSPEQAKGKPVDKRADIWAFGCVLYEMLTGRKAFDGEDVTDTLTAVMRDTPDWSALPAQTPSTIRTLLRRCIEKDPRKRAPHMAIARMEIDDAMTSTGELVRAPSGEPSPVNARNVAAVVIVVGSIALIGGWALGRSARPAPDTGGGEVTRFELTVPELFMRIATRAGSMALSNDGRRLAFIAVNSTNRAALFVRELSSLEPKVIQQAGAVVAWATAAPSWSPDGRELLISVARVGGSEVNDASTQGGAVQRIDPFGGPPTTLAEWGRYAIWGSAGAIVYGGSDGRIYRVSEDGGPSTAITELDADGGEVVHIPSSFLPDGRRFIFMAQNRDTEKSAMFVAPIDGGPRSPLAVPATRVLYAGDWLLYIRDRTLVAHRMNAATTSLEGGPRSIATGVADFAASPSGALVIAPPDNAILKMAWLDSQGVAGSPVADASTYAGVSPPDLSPDGTRMVFIRPDANGPSDLWQVDLERNVPTRLTATPNAEDAAVYSADGKSIVFSSNRSGSFDLYRRAADGSGGDELLFASPIRKTPKSISPDGSVLLFTQSGTATGPDIWALPLTGERTPRPLVVTRAFEGYAQFSPDGRWIAYCAGELGESDQVFVEPYPPTGARTRLSTTQGSSPRWSASGREVYYGTPAGQIMRVAVTMSGGTVRAGAPESVLTAPELFSHNGFVLDARSRILALSPENNRRQEPATVILNWPLLLKESSPR